MAKLVWNETGTKTYEHGVKNGVLYPSDESGGYEHGVPWSGIVSVSENAEGGDSNDIHADNIKWLSLNSAESLRLGVEAYMYPEKFAECDGTKEAAAGIRVYHQTRKPFGFSYTTIKGNDVKGDDYGELIHIAYGCKASPSERSYQTISDSPEPITFNWDFSTTPVEVPGFKPTSLIVIDTTKLDASKIKKIKDQLFGTDTTEATLPMPKELFDLVK